MAALGLLQADDTNAAKTFWQRQARLTAGRINFSWWLAFFLPASFAIGLIFGCLIILARQHAMQLFTILLAGIAVFFLAAVICLLLVRRRFFTMVDGLVYLESHLNLNSRLSSANAGIGSWPKPLQDCQVFSWRLGRIIGPLFLSAGFLVLAFYIPVTVKDASPQFRPEKPLAWQQAESWIELLQDQELIEQQSVARFDQQLSDLKNQDLENWYDHSSMEASDSLRDQLNSSMQELKDVFENLDAALAVKQQVPKDNSQSTEEGQKASDKSGSGSRSENQSFQDSHSTDSNQGAAETQRLNKALSDLESVRLTISKKVLKELKRMETGEGAAVSEKELGELRDKLGESMALLEKALGEGQQGQTAFLESSQAGDSSPQQKGGSAGRGPGSVPPVLNQRQSPRLTHRTASVSGSRFDNAEIGEQIGILKGEHQVDKNRYSGMLKSGSLKSGGAGERQVWKDSFNPDEQQVLKKYFE